MLVFETWTFEEMEKEEKEDDRKEELYYKGMSLEELREEYKKAKKLCLNLYEEKEKYKELSEIEYEKVYEAEIACDF